MSKYFIDHSKLIVHRTAFITDGCNHHKILHKHLEESNSDEQVLQLINHDDYHQCPQCFEYFSLEKDKHDYVRY